LTSRSFEQKPKKKKIINGGGGKVQDRGGSFDIDCSQAQNEEHWQGGEPSPIEDQRKKKAVLGLWKSQLIESDLVICVERSGYDVIVGALRVGCLSHFRQTPKKRHGEPKASNKNVQSHIQGVSGSARKSMKDVKRAKSNDALWKKTCRKVVVSSRSDEIYGLDPRQIEKNQHRKWGGGGAKPQKAKKKVCERKNSSPKQARIWGSAGADSYGNSRQNNQNRGENQAM